MDYKKRNEEILEKLRDLRVSWASTNNRAAKEIEEAIPELIESEDERIRKEIIDFATKANNGVTSILANNYNFNKWIAWVEKKAEQKTVVIIPKFRVGDVIRPKGSTAEYTIESISEECYHGKGWGLHLSNDDDYELVEQKPAEWSERDKEEFQIAIDTLVEAGQQYSAHWLKSLKERVQHQNMWISVDKEVYIKEPILAQKKDKSDVWEGYTVIADHTLDPLVYERYINIENISTQSLWKPSEGQLECLDYAIKKEERDYSSLTGNRIYLNLKCLREELEKLKD